MALEFVTMWAIRERIRAGRIAKEMEARGWTRAHAFFFQMGGLVRLQQDSTGKISYKTLRYGSRHESDRLAEIRNIKMPRIPQREIDDHGKGDVVAKSMVIIQTTWFVAQCVERSVHGLGLTDIELVTLAFATLNLITYAFWWEKPLNAEYPIYFDEDGKRVDGPEEGSGEGMKYRGICGYVKEWIDSRQKHGIAKTIWNKVVKALFLTIFGPLMDMMVDRNDKDREKNFIRTVGSNSDVVKLLAVGSMTRVVFGGIHLFAWNFQFPTDLERWLWRGASLTLTVIPPFLAIIAFLIFLDFKYESDLTEYPAIPVYYLTLFIFPPIYFVARIVILFLAFYTLRALPEYAFQSAKWTEFLPHI
ncbi:hypothetical protein AX16_001954 [Volvariella volvacea WC 439]|nr:hypothetical protein AX16_001954 [Volvariella volvacea WC 439]